MAANQMLPADRYDLKRIRALFGMSQAQFAKAFGLSPWAVRAWEQGRRKPDPTSQTLLTIIAHEPEAVLRAVAMRSPSQETTTEE